MPGPSRRSEHCFGTRASIERVRASNGRPRQTSPAPYGLWPKPLVFRSVQQHPNIPGPCRCFAPLCGPYFPTPGPLESPRGAIQPMLFCLRVGAWSAVKREQGRPCGLQGREGMHQLHGLITVGAERAARRRHGKYFGRTMRMPWPGAISRCAQAGSPKPTQE